MGYGIGSTVPAVKNTAFNTFLLFYYTQVLGLSGTLSGAALLIGLCFDAVTDPLMGSISDNFKSKFGRRHPFMAMAVIPLSLSLYLLFDPPAAMGRKGLFLWMTTFVIAVRLMLTLFQVPYLALGAELTEDYVERTTVSTYRTTFGFFSGIAATIIAFFIFFPETKTHQLGQMNAAGYPSFAIFCAIVIVIMAMVCILATRKEIPFLPRARENQSSLRLSRLYRELKLALSNPSFRIIFITTLFSGTLNGVYINIGLHVNTYFWEFNSRNLAILSTSLLFSAILTFFIMRWIEKFEKKKAYIATCLLTSFGSVLVLLRLFDLLPPNGSPILFKNHLFLFPLHVCPGPG